MECGTAEVMSTEERCHTEGIKEGVGEERSVEARSPL